jgi:hypothetical protein
MLGILSPKGEGFADPLLGTLKNFAALAKEALGERAVGKPVEVWFQML